MPSCLPCCFSSQPRRGVSDELEKVLAERDFLQQQCQELQSRGGAPLNVEALQEQIRKTSRSQPEFAKQLQHCKTKNARNARNGHVLKTSAADFAAASIYDQDWLLNSIGIEPDVPWLLVEAWFANSLLGEQWLHWDDLEKDSTKASSPAYNILMETRLLFSRNGDRKPSIESTCQGGLLEHLGNLQLHFKLEGVGTEKVLSKLQLSCTRACRAESIPRNVKLQVWCWGGAISAETSKSCERTPATQTTCWLEALASDSPDNTETNQWLQLSSEALVIGRHHPFIQGLLDGKKHFLKCVSREHLRLSFDKKCKILQVDNISGNPIVIQSDGLEMQSSTSSTRTQIIRAGKVGRAQHGDTLRLFRPDSENESAKEDSFISATYLLSFRIVVQQTEIVCAGRSCEGVGGDRLYKVESRGSSDCKIYCESCCVDLQLKSSAYSFKQLDVALPAPWNLLCESNDSAKVETYPGIEDHFTWGADFGAQRLCIPALTPAFEAVA